MMRTPAPDAQKGFTLTEVLVAMLVLSIGLLGLASLQVTSLRNNHSAFQLSLATNLSYGIIDRMRANRPAARAGEYNLALAVAAPTGTSRANQDVAGWRQAIASRLPGGAGAIAVDDDRVTVVVEWTPGGEQGTRRVQTETEL